MPISINLFLSLIIGTIFWSYYKGDNVFRTVCPKSDYLKVQFEISKTTTS